MPELCFALFVKPTHDTATRINAREIGELVLGGHHDHRK